METLIPTLTIILVPIITEYVKKFNRWVNTNYPRLMKQIPKPVIPVIAIVIGCSLPAIGALAVTYESNLWLNFLLGLAGIGVREVVVNLKKNTPLGQYIGRVAPQKISEADSES